MSRSIEVRCHPLTNNPNLAWKELESSQVVQKVQPLPLNLPVRDDAVRFVCMSDTHSRTYRLRYDVPPGDVFLHAGDFTGFGDRREVKDFNKFLGSLPHQYKVVIAGNHEISFDPLCSRSFGVTSAQDCLAFSQDLRKLLTNCIYLEDSSVELFGLTIYGTPWQPTYHNWAFNLPRGEACLQKWNQIPADVDVLLTHTPPLGHGDLAVSGVRAGCTELLLSIQRRIKPKYHVFGHIHEGYGITTDRQTVFINCSVCDVRYQPLNPPVIFDIPLKDGQTKSQRQFDFQPKFRFNSCDKQCKHNRRQRLCNNNNNHCCIL